MDNSQLKDSAPQPKKKIPALWFLLVVIIAAGLVIGAYFLTQCDQDDKTVMTLNTNSVTNANTNSNANANVNVNGNSNSNQPANTNNDIIPVSDMQVVTYQRYNHGLQISIPKDWTSGYTSQGTTEEESLLWAYSTATENSSSLSLGLGFFNNTDPTFDQWLEKRKTALKTTHNNKTIIDTGDIVNGIHLIYEKNTNNDVNDTYETQYGYITQGTRVYAISISGDRSIMTVSQSVIEAMLKSFTFIDPKPFVQIINPPEKKEVAVTGSALGISWLADPEELNLIENNKNGDGTYFSSRRYYKVGTITNQPYTAQDLVVIIERPEGPVFRDNLYRAVYDAESASLVYLETGSDDLLQISYPFQYDTRATLPSLNMPTTILIPRSTTKLIAEEFDPNKMFTDYQRLEKKFTDPSVGDVSLDLDNNCYIVKQKDGTAKRYIYKLDFIQGDLTNVGQFNFDATGFLPEITWTDGSVVSKEYTYNDPTGGCGTRFCHFMSTPDELGGEQAIVATGKTSSGDDVYEYADKNNPALKEVYDSFYVPTEETKISYEAFTADHPVFFWKDPFGVWLRFKKAAYIPAAECGKPVIYLYPKKETRVNVKVRPTGGFTVTEPAYPDDGWTVLARPDGQLKTDKGDVYPYLFWEGVGLNYEIPKQGFVVARPEVNQFLKEKLARLGLNEKESAEFIDFWQTKLEVKPYVFVTFVDQAVFDQLAPLTVTPKPDQVIRVFMDYKPLDQPVKVIPQTLITPVRHGFTVVEWGGALHR